jgi:hypothetical protein
MAKEKMQPQDPPSEEFTRFERMARALFGVNKRDVLKREPEKRKARTTESGERSPLVK